MAKFYQYLKGENQGKVTTLDYIDDSDPDIVLFVFKDGFKCNKELISDINNSNAYSNLQTIMAEVENKSNIWRFEKQEIKPTSKTAEGEDAQQYEAADPYFTDKNGNVLHRRAVLKINAIPPRKTFSHVENEDHYYIRYKKEQEEKEQQAAIKEEVNNEVKQQENEIVIANPKITKDNILLKENLTANSIVIPDTLDTFSINLDNLNIKYKNIEIISGETHVKLPLQETLKTLLENNKNQSEDFKNSPVSIMIQNCKKEPCEVGLTLQMDMPNNTIYKMIKENYPEGWTDTFIENIVNNLSTDTIRKTLKEALLSFYENEYSKN